MAAAKSVSFLMPLRGYHAYKDIWTPEEGQTIVLEVEPGNEFDKFAISGKYENVIVGRVPKELSRTIHGLLSSQDDNVQITAMVHDRNKQRSVNKKGLEIILKILLTGPVLRLRSIEKILRRRKNGIIKLVPAAESEDKLSNLSK